MEPQFDASTAARAEEETNNVSAPAPRRGFGAMDPEKQREIARKGGRAAHARGKAHRFTAEEAKVAGRKGGEVVSQNREHMAAIGRKGGEARGSSARNNAARGAAARLGAEGARSAASDTYRSTEGRADVSRTTANRGDTDRTQQLRADEFPADQARASQTRESSIGGSNVQDSPTSRDVSTARP